MNKEERKKLLEEKLYRMKAFDRERCADGYAAVIDLSLIHILLLTSIGIKSIMIINGRVSKAKSMNGRRLPILELQLSEILPTVIPETTSTSKAIDMMVPEREEPIPTQSVIKTIKYVDIKLYAAP